MLAKLEECKLFAFCEANSYCDAGVGPQREPDQGTVTALGGPLIKHLAHLMLVTQGIEGLAQLQMLYSLDLADNQIETIEASSCLVLQCL